MYKHLECQEVWWLKPATVANLGGKDQTIVVWGEPRQKVYETPSLPVAGHSGAYLSSYLCRKEQIGGSWSRPVQA
jgi:hypothetical protein